MVTGTAAERDAAYVLVALPARSQMHVAVAPRVVRRAKRKLEAEMLKHEFLASMVSRRTS